MRTPKFLSLALIGATLAVSAQTEPNRMIVAATDGTTSAYMIERVDEIRFATVSGEVAADVEIESFSLTEITLSIIRTSFCSGFMIDVIPGVMARQLMANPASVASYLKSKNASTYYEDFYSGTISDIELQAGTEYAVVTVGIDQYGVACEARAEYFTTEGPTIVGNPQIEVSFVSSTKNEITLHYKANADVSSFYTVIGEKGTLQTQYEQFATMYGFSNIGEMVKMWGLSLSGNSDQDHTYTQLNVGTDYEVYIQPLDKEGNFADLIIFDCSTTKQGGDGPSTVSITLGDYLLQDWNGEQLPSQFITFTPNDQTWCYRYNVVLAENYDSDKEGYIADLRSDPPMPTVYWFFYDPITTDFQINPGVAAVAIAAGKNANGEWGEVTELRFTTPDTPSSARQRDTKAVGTRARQTNPTLPGHVPSATSVTLSH